nr:complement C1q subcomponent subunit A-like [Oncorhynchus nerka]
MATWWLRWGTAAVMVGSILASFVTSVAMEPSCNANLGYPGIPGVPGAHGAYGKDGPKGEKGDPGNTHYPVMACNASLSGLCNIDTKLMLLWYPVVVVKVFCDFKVIIVLGYVIKDVVLVVKVGFCDSSSGFLVTSGSVVLDLLEGDVVSLQPTDNNAIITKDERADNTFTGFLILPNS